MPSPRMMVANSSMYDVHSAPMPPSSPVAPIRLEQLPLILGSFQLKQETGCHMPCDVRSACKAAVGQQRPFWNRIL